MSHANNNVFAFRIVCCFLILLNAAGCWCTVRLNRLFVANVILIFPIQLITSDFHFTVIIARSWAYFAQVSVMPVMHGLI